MFLIYSLWVRLVKRIWNWKQKYTSMFDVLIYVSSIATIVFLSNKEWVWLVKQIYKLEILKQPLLKGISLSGEKDYLWNSKIAIKVNNCSKNIALHVIHPTHKLKDRKIWLIKRQTFLSQTSYVLIGILI